MPDPMNPTPEGRRPITDAERELMQHTLGTSEGKKSYRNYFAAARDTPDWFVCERLVGYGLMKGGSLLSYGRYFHCTDVGIAAAGANP